MRSTFFALTFRYKILIFVGAADKCLKKLEIRWKKIVGIPLSSHVVVVVFKCRLLHHNKYQLVFQLNWLYNAVPENHKSLLSLYTVLLLLPW